MAHRVLVQLCGRTAVSCNYCSLQLVQPICCYQVFMERL